MTETLDTPHSSAGPEGRSTEASERGTLRIDREVLRKIVEHAANLEPDCVDTPRRFGTGGHGTSARVSGPDRGLRIRLDLALRYPAPVAATVRALRERVRTELDRMTNCRVHAIDVRVNALVPDPRKPRVD
ncbi:Asp23/Gls24 family envelope stress response protein [Actinopolyspora mortivallis]|uniref:Asp23/Gls24 family protein n=1 Tax=Actinopolyspora mortivallis TaxID=33906 RepID=A0A2T0H1F1_ACTMO|nr:Asp23/Gls24 family envelope stress response protein [Actinopolyspora mortivallis]PRW65083.1 hypothetical protein CEP50_00660 [Actinopolyspora mortivallis]